MLLEEKGEGVARQETLVQICGVRGRGGGVCLQTNRDTEAREGVAAGVEQDSWRRLTTPLHEKEAEGGGGL